MEQIPEAVKAAIESERQRKYQEFKREREIEERQKAEGEALDRDIFFYMKRHNVSYKHAFLAITKNLRRAF
ncbi:hypothetical protein [Avibacterium paragallinarum]|uniref:hypothetical protein n=1 Tax=Avibacterium paragallinarum TaxID=728 RepID=UPI003987F30E